MSTTKHDVELAPDVVESREARTQRISMGVLVGLMGVLLVYLAFSAQGTANFALSDALDDIQLPMIALPATITVAVAAVFTLAASAGFLSGRLNKRWTAIAATVAGLSVVIGFLAWAAADRAAPFALSNQLNGSLALATPLALGALCGVLCERAGVVNVAIEGQMLSAAFTAAIVGSITGSITAALIAAMLAGMLMASLLALFAIKYLVDQVVLGVVINLLAAGMTGFIFDQLVKPNARTLNLNDAPVMAEIPIPLLSDIPFFGPVLFNQTILAYLAVVSVVLVWFLVFRTKWGLRVRAVGEHPEAADTVGINVHRVQWSAVLAGGLFAGLGGAYFTLGVTGSFEGHHGRLRLHRAGRADHGPVESDLGRFDGAVLRIRHADVPAGANDRHPGPKLPAADAAIRRDHHRCCGPGWQGQGAGP